MVNVGIIGCGGVAISRHIPAINKLKTAKLHGFFDGNKPRADELAAEFSARSYSSLDEMLADNDLDAVIVCTATKSHCELTVAALNAGKHVLCEKPMAANAKDAVEMIRAAEKSGKKLMISHNQRLYEPHKKAKELLDAGVIGYLITFRTFLGIKGPEYSSVLGANNAYFNKEKSGRGVVSDVGSHRIDLMRYITGKEYEKVFAYTPTLSKKYPDGGLIDVDDNAFATVQMSDSIVGTIITSWSSMSGNDRKTMLFGTEGVITVYADDCALKIEGKDGSVTKMDFAENTSQNVVLLTDIDKCFIDSIINDTQPIVSGRDGLAVITAIDAMEKSNLIGSWVDVEKPKI